MPAWGGATVKNLPSAIIIVETTMPKTGGQPYIERICERNGISVWVVDGTYIRCHIDIEFTNFGQHYRFGFIPVDEFWLDREAAGSEREFFIEHLLIERGLMAGGKSYEEALLTADAKELLARKRARDAVDYQDPAARIDPRMVHLKLLKRLEHGVKAWIVSGRMVRDIFYIDFTEGGHDLVYGFVPENEIWIDDALDERDRPYVLLHEVHERGLMANGWSYERAHCDASRFERKLRKDPDSVTLALVKWRADYRKRYKNPASVKK